MEEINSNLGTYINKLIKTIETQASFSFGNKRIVNKTRIDDILCCIDVNFPKILKAFQKEYDADKNVRSFSIYQSLINNIKITPFWNKDSYMVNYKQVLDIVEVLKQAFVADVNYIKKTYPNLLNESN